MTVTEAQALGLWCPFARVMSVERRPNDTSGGSAAVNRGLNASGKDIAIGLCIGSQCMLFQFADPEYETSDEQMTDEQIAAGGWERDPENSGTLVTKYRKPRKNRRGFCGLGRSG